jgi:hypothetical protein
VTDELANAVVVDFPLRGERWMAVTTPAHRVPSHGTDMLGQRYAFDFLKVDERPGLSFHPLAGTLRGNLLGGRTRDCYAWGAPVHAPFDGEVVAASDGIPERQWIHPLRELFGAIRSAVTFTPSKIPRVVGNHVILGGEPGFAVFAHLTTGSVTVRPGQRVMTGELLGRVGHTGNSTSAHLHFQVMDAPDPMTAKGIPCAFRRYDVLQDGIWVPVREGIPSNTERIRSVDG